MRCWMLLFVVSACVTRIATADVAVVCSDDASAAEDLAAKEVQRYFFLRTGALAPIVDAVPLDTDAIAVTRHDRPLAADAMTSTDLTPQGYMLRSIDSDGRRILYIVGADDAGVLYGAYRFAELLGVRFYLHGDTVPDGRIAPALPDVMETRRPLFSLRGIQPFHDFPEGPDWWNTDAYQAIIAQLPKLGMNFIGLHTYPEERPNAEPSVWIGLREDAAANGDVSFSYPSLYYNTALDASWGFAPKSIDDYLFGGSLLYERDPYGNAVQLGHYPMPQTPEACNEVFNRTGAMLRQAFDVAHRLQVQTCVGTETPLVVPKRVRDRLGEDEKLAKPIGGRTVAYGEPIAGTDDDPLYQSVRFDLEGYRIAVPNGRYRVTLQFCEVAHGAPGGRVFDVTIEGEKLIDDLDIFAMVGKNRALDYPFDIAIADGALDIAFGKEVEYPVISAIAVEGEQANVRVNCGGGAYGDYAADEGGPVSREAVQRLYEGIFSRIARSYPVDYYWFWTPEGWTWSGVSDQQVKDTLDDIEAAIAAAEAVDAPFTLATCGWVLGPPQDRALFDKTLPKSMPVSCINRAVGHDPVEPGFADVHGRDKWAIPWLEDDPAMTSPQLWVGRMRRDASDALKYGCTGLMGIHWRTRVLGPNVAALAQAGWDQDAWQAPEPATGAVGGRKAAFADHEIADTELDPVYRDVRYDMSAYRLDVPNGTYAVTLQFCEPFYGETGKRVFGVNLQGRPAIDSLDIFAIAGKDRALDYTFENIAVSDGLLNIEFVPQVEYPSVAGIVITSREHALKINCGGGGWEDYAADDAAEAPAGYPTGDFYRDWTLHEFGPEIADAATALFVEIDGKLPRPSDWINGPGGYKPDDRPWEQVQNEFAFADEFAALRDQVHGAGNLERFDYWRHTLEYLRATAKMRCAWHVFNAAMEQAKAAPEADRARVAREQALPARIALVDAVEDVYAHLLAHVSTSGGMGTLTNLEQHTMPHMLAAPGQELAAMLGEPLPAEAEPSTQYSGAPRVFVWPARTMIEAGETLVVTARVLSAEPPQGVTLYWSPLGQNAWQTQPMRHVDRGVYEAGLPPESHGNAAFEYYVAADTAGTSVHWPASAPELPQTVVVMAPCEGV